ncbi:MAG: hypothetical protein HY831_03950 [Candidatus Aenigmarchaeota archaeon]|nr:hypothetical protein [Candidatus Aenigmarchaeota archaeon]
MTSLTVVRNELRPLSDYVVRNAREVTARQVLADPSCADIGEILLQATNYPVVARHYEGPGIGKGAWAGAVQYTKDGKTFYLPPGAIKSEEDLRSSNDIDAIEGMKREIELKKGHVIPYKDGKKFRLYDFKDNSGFARNVLEADYNNQEARQEADAKRLEAWKKGRILQSFDPDNQDHAEIVRNLRGYQWRREDGFSGNVPVDWFSSSDGIPLDVDAGWYFYSFDYHNDNLGCLFASGSEQFARKK